MNTIIMIFICLLFIVGLSFGVAYLYLQNKKNSNSNNLKIVEPIDEEISASSARSIILTQIENVKQLAVLRKTYQSGIDIHDSTKIFGFNLPGTSKKLSLDYEITVVCGCDLDKIKISKSFTNGRHLKINLPSSEILDIYPNIDSLVVRDKDSGIFASDVQVEEQNKEIAADVENVRENLIENGILEESNRNVVQIIKSITEPLNIEADINFLDKNLFNSRPDLLRLE